MASWFPYALVSFATTFSMVDGISPLMKTIPALVAKSSGVWNPIIYLLVNSQFRNALWSYMPKIDVSISSLKAQKPNSPQLQQHFDNLQSFQNPPISTPASPVNDETVKSDPILMSSLENSKCQVTVKMAVVLDDIDLPCTAV